MIHDNGDDPAGPVFPARRDEIVGDVRYHPGLAALGIEPKTVVVWLPPSYAEERGATYPVLYMQDGHNILDPATSYAGADWCIDEVTTELGHQRRIREPIVVGNYAGEERLKEYGHGPAGRAYLRWMVDELKPFIDAEYRTRPGRDSTAIMGASMGGLISFLAVWHHPDVFSMAGCLSPAFETAPSLATEVATSSWPSLPVRVYLDNGNDDFDRRLQPATDEMLAVLDGRGFVRDRDLIWIHDPDGIHHEDSWARRVWRPLEWFFGRR